MVTLNPSRRDFIAGTVGGFVLGQALPPKPGITGTIVGASHRTGHLLRSASTGSARETIRRDVLIVGGGISGLSAAWRLKDFGLDVEIVDLEPFVGGTSAWGETGVVPHPWGAHYLPAPNLEARAALRLLRDMGALTHFDAASRPVFDPRRLCHAPQERLFYKGAWHGGLAPADALDDAEREEMERFEDRMDEMQERKGSDGRYFFQIPLQLSSRDPEALALDRLSFAAWLDREGFKTPFVRWFARYATLDDFGAEPELVSAWAGIHYFASRREESDALAGSRFLVWPEGNGRLAKELLVASRALFSTGSLAVSIEETPSTAVAMVIDASTSEMRRIEARAAIVAVPGFVGKRIAPWAASRFPTRTASPWTVANLHVERALDPDLPWDSVLYDGSGLGYVDAGHMAGPPSKHTVLTYFRAFGSEDVAASRTTLLEASWADLARSAFTDLAPAHPDLEEQCSRIDVMVWGHAMPRPTPGFLDPRIFDPTDGPPRGVELGERISYGHVDVPGMALFEEAQRAGVLAAERALETLGLPADESWA